MKVKSVTASRIRKLRIVHGLRQTQLAEKSGIRSDIISHFESGRRHPSLDSLSKIARVLHTTLDYLADFQSISVNQKPQNKTKGKANGKSHRRTPRR